MESQISSLKVLYEENVQCSPERYEFGKIEYFVTVPIPPPNLYSGKSPSFFLCLTKIHARKINDHFTKIKKQLILFHIKIIKIFDISIPTQSKTTT